MVDGGKLTAVYGMWMILRYPVQMRAKQKKMLNQLENNMGKLRTTTGRKHTYPQNGPKYLIREGGGQVLVVDVEEERLLKIFHR